MLPQFPKQNFSARFPNVSPGAVDLLEKMLVFDPNRRITGTPLILAFLITLKLKIHEALGLIFNLIRIKYYMLHQFVCRYVLILSQCARGLSFLLFLSNSFIFLHHCLQLMRLCATHILPPFMISMRSPFAQDHSVLILNIHLLLKKISRSSSIGKLYISIPIQLIEVGDVVCVVYHLKCIPWF